MKNSIFNAVCKTRYLALLVVLILTCGNAWGTSRTWPKTTAIPGTATSIAGDNNVTIMTSSTNSYTNPLRVYANTTITIAVASGYTIESVTYTASSTGNYVTYAQNATVSPNVTPTVSGTNVTWSFSSTTTGFTFKPATQTRSNGITVVYSATGGGSTCATPTFNNGTGTYNNNVSVTISTETDGATIHYTTSGTAPTCSTGTTGTSVTINSTGTVLKAIACKDGSDASEVASATYTLKCANPTGLTTGSYLGTQTITLATATNGADIYYTTNGNAPSASSTHYTAPFTVSSTTTIKAIAIKSNYANSDVASATYTITPAYTVTWKNQGSNVTTTNVASGSKPVFPDMSAQSGCGKYTYFYGWAEDTWSDEVTSPGTSSTVKVYKSASEMPNVTGDGVVYHAVWGDSPGGWSIVSSIAVDDVVVFAYTNGSSYYKELSGVSNSMGQVSNYSSTPSGLYPLTVCAGTASGYFAFKNGSNYLKGTTSNSLETETSVTDASSWSVSITNGVAEIENKAHSGRKLKGNTSQYRIVNYSNSNANNINIWKQSADAKCVTSCCNQLDAPENPGETPNSTGAVLTWDAVTGATGYEVKIDGGEWTSTGNGTTTGYTITGKACGGTSVSWQVRATGNGTTNCEKGAATTARNFTTTACACTNQYTYFWGTQITNDNPSSSAYASHHFECFNTWNSTEGKTGLITLPNSDTENYWFVGYNGNYYNSNLPGGGRSWCTAIADMNFANSQSDGKVLGWDGGYSYPRGATGYIRIYSDNTNSNKYAAFIPSGYILRWKNNRNSDAWTSYPFTDTGASNYWETDLVQLGADLSSDKVWVGLPTSGMSESFTWCGKSEEKNLIGVGKKTGASSWAANGIVAADAGQKGKWRIEITNNATNWNLHFVPYWEASYDANGGGAVSTTATNVGPVSCEGDATARQVTMPAAPSYEHHEFDGWLSSADAQTYAAAVTVSLTQNTTFTAQWHNASYNISAALTNVTSGTSFPVTYTYTGSAANVTYTFVASSGYRLPDAVTVTGCTYTWDKTTGELTLTGTIEGAVSITISGTRTHTVSWTVGGSSTWTKAAGGTFTGQDPYDDGATLVVAPNPAVPSACDGKVFIGWTTDAEITTETNTAPTLISEGTAVDGDATYRAVFADVTGYPDKFKRVTQLSDISEGSQIAIGFYVTSNIKLCGLDFNGWTTYSCATGVTEDGNSRIDKPSAANTWNVSKSGNYWVFTNAGDGSTKMGIGTTSSNNPLDPASTTYYKWEIGANSSGTNHFYLRLYDGSAMTYCALELYQSTWKIYDVTSSGTHVYSSSAYTALKLYVPAGTRTNYITQCSSCTTPSSVTASDVTNNSATISWSGVSQTQQVGGSGTGFTVLWGTDATRANNNNTANVAAGTTTYNLTGLSEGTHYYVWVQSKCDDSWCATPADFTTLVSHTATFYDVDGTTPLQSGSVIEGSAITYSGSTPVSCDAGVDASTTFVGWASAPWDGKVAKASIPVGTTFYDIAGGESLPNMGNNNMSFYPVFAKATGDPLTNHAWTYTFSAQTYKANDTKTLAGTEGGNTVNADWELLTYNQSSEAITNWGSFDSGRGSKIGKNDDDYVTYMYLSSASFDGTVTAVKISTSGNSGVTANVSATVGGTTFYNGVNSSLDISSSNAEYSFTGSKAISGDDEVVFIWEQESTKALYIKKIEVDYSTGGDISYSNYMTTCSQCTTPSGLEASSITEAGATITWSGTSNSGTTGFKVLWSTNSTRPAPASGNNGDTNADTKTYSITGLNAGTTYYVWVQSKCDGSWSSSINFTTKAIHAITLTADNGTIVGGSPINVVDGATLTFPNVTGTSCGSFVGWTTGDYDNVAAPATLYANGAEKANITADESYKALYRTASGAETNVTDNWTGTKIGVSIYDDWSGKVDASAAVYAGNSTKNSSYSNCLQLRSTNNSGIITTTSGGKAKKVTVTWNSNTTNGNTLDVYGKNTAYSAVSDLYSNDANVKGTKIGSIVKGTSTELTIDGDYAYIGVRSNSGALYIDNLAIEWYGLPMKYTTAPACDPMVSMTSSFSTFSYVYAAGPSSSQSFTVSGIQLGADLVVTAPANYEVCKTADGTYTSSVSYTPTDGAVAATVYIRLAAGLNVGTYNYVAASGVAVTSTGATTANAALNGSVTKADCAITFTDFNAVDHYEGVLEYGSSVTVSYNYTYPGDGTFSITHSPNTGTFNKTDKTLTVSVAGIWTLNASATAGSNYNKPANASAEIRVKCVDTYVDYIHNKTIKAYGSGSTVTDGKMEDWGSGYTVPYIDDNATETSGSCQQTHFKFVGWVSEDDINIADGTFKSGYTLIEAGTAEKRATTKTYYAVWAKQEE